MEEIIVDNTVWFIYTGTIYQGQLIEKQVQFDNTILCKVRCPYGVLFFRENKLYSTRDELVEAITYKSVI